MQQEFQSRGLAVTRKISERVEEETEVETSMTEEDMKQHLNDVLKEIRSTKSNSLNR